MSYKIIARTNQYIANRDIRFNGKCEIVLISGLSLKEAQKKLLEFFCEQVNEFIPNWGIAVNAKRFYQCACCEAHPTREDGTRMYEYDSRYYEIVKEEMCLMDEILKRFTPVYVYQEEGMDEDDFDEAVREKAVEIYCDILSEIENEQKKAANELIDALTIDDYNYIITKFCNQIINYTA